jgi:hypothetical protein
VVGEGQGRFFNINVPWDLPPELVEKFESAGNAPLRRLRNLPCRSSSPSMQLEVPGDAEYLAAFNLVPLQTLHLPHCTLDSLASSSDARCPSRGANSHIQNVITLKSAENISTAIIPLNAIHSKAASSR